MRWFLNENARLLLLEDFRKLPRVVDPTSREWERWLKDTKPTAFVAFEQEAAVENSTAMYLSVMHPLVRQAARWLQLDEPAYVSLNVVSSAVPQGEHLFALYRWSKRGVKLDEVLVPVASEPTIEGELLTLLQTATESSGKDLPPSSEFDAIDISHHAKWTAAQASHMADNRLQVEHRIQSLSVSHRGRCKAIEDQIARAANEKIQVMKQSELGRANADYQRRLEELEQAAKSGDIHAKSVLFGVLNVQRLRER